MKAIPPNARLVVASRQWKMRRELGHRFVKGRIKTGDLSCRRIELFGLAYDTQGRRDVQRSEVRCCFELREDLRGDDHVIAQLGAAVHDRGRPGRLPFTFRHDEPPHLTYENKKRTLDAVGQVREASDVRNRIHPAKPSISVFCHLFIGKMLTTLPRILSDEEGRNTDTFDVLDRSIRDIPLVLIEKAIELRTSNPKAFRNSLTAMCAAVCDTFRPATAAEFVERLNQDIRSEIEAGKSIGREYAGRCEQSAAVAAGNCAPM